MAAVTLVVGDESLLVDRAVSHALSDIDAPRRDVDAAETSVGELVELTSPSLFADERAVVIRNVQDADKALGEALVRSVEQPEDGLGLVLTHAGGPKGKALLQSLTGAGAVVVTAVKLKTTRDREQFVVDEAKAAGGALDREAATVLVAAIGTDLRELSTAAAQLVADCGRQVGMESVGAYYRGRAETSGFTVADRAVEGDVAAALETLRWAFATGVDPILVSSSLAANLRLIALVGAAGRGSPDSLAGPLGMPAWKIRRAQGWLRRWRPEALAGAVAAVATADADLKGAADDAAYAVERAVIAVANAAGAA